jgi:non-homologous end joining protein Ku
VIKQNVKVKNGNSEKAQYVIITDKEILKVPKQ